MSSDDSSSLFDDAKEIFDGVFDDEPDNEQDDLENLLENGQTRELTDFDYEEIVLDTLEASNSRLEFIRRVHPDHHGSDELFQAYQRLKQGPTDMLLKDFKEPSQKTTEETETPTETQEEDNMEEIRGLAGYTGNEYQEALDLVEDHETALEMLEYEGNTELARKVLETEWKIDNASDYITEEMFSEGSLTGEAELILGELEKDERKKTVQELIENNQIYEDSENITTTWFQNDTLMGYDKEKGHNVKIELYDEIEASLTLGGLREMIEETKEGLENYDIASLKSVYESEGQIENEELESYVKSLI